MLFRSRVREEVPDLGEAADGVDLVEHDETQDRADAGDGAEELERHRVVDLRALDEVRFHGVDMLVVGVDHGQVGAAQRDGACSYNVGVVTNFLMSGVSGSALADAAGTGTVLVPEALRSYLGTDRIVPRKF